MAQESGHTVCAVADQGQVFIYLFRRMKGELYITLLELSEYCGVIYHAHVIHFPQGSPFTQMSPSSIRPRGCGCKHQLPETAFQQLLIQ